MARIPRVPEHGQVSLALGVREAEEGLVVRSSLHTFGCSGHQAVVHDPGGSQEQEQKQEQEHK